MDKNLYIVAGCNGAGKTTASYSILPEILNCKEFVNADEIARGLSPFQPEKVSIEAGRIMLKRIDELLYGNKTFAFETTLASKSYKNKIKAAKAKDYTVTLLFFWLQTVDLAIQRVETRVLLGGHHVEADVIERRYVNGIKNLFDIYFSLADNVLIIDNSESIHQIIAKKINNSDLQIIDNLKFNKIRQCHENERI